MDAVPQSVCSIFVKGLNKNTATSMLMSVFSRFGTVVQCQIARHRSGRSAGFAIVTYAEHDEAALALQSVDNSLFLGRRLNVRWYQPERDSMSAQQMQMLSYGQDFVNQQMHAAAAAAAFCTLAHGDTTQRMPTSDQGAMSIWTPAPEPAQVSKEGLGGHEEPAKDANWSAMVGMWLNDYESLHSDERRTTTQSILSCTPHRRTTNQSAFSHTQDLVDISAFRLTADSIQEDAALAGLMAQHVKEDPGSFGKSRLATKWSRASGSGGGSIIEERFSEGGGSSNASQLGSDEVSLLGTTTVPSGVVREKSSGNCMADVVLPSTEDITAAMRSVFSLSPTSSQEQEVNNVTLSRDVMSDQQAGKEQAIWIPAPPKHLTAGKPLPPRAPHAKMKASLELVGMQQRKHQAAAAAAIESQAAAAMATVSDAQQQYAAALHQLNSARAQILAAAASIQVPPHAMHHAFHHHQQPEAFMQAAFHQSMMQGMMGGMPPPPPPVYQRQSMSRMGF